MTRYIQHNQKCFACGLQKAPAYLGYDVETMKTYCIDKERCKKAAHIPKTDLIPCTNEDLLAAITEFFPQDVEVTFNRLLGKVASTRLQPAHIMHLLKTSEAEGLSSIQATLINVIEADMKARNVDYISLTEQVIKPQTQPIEVPSEDPLIPEQPEEEQSKPLKLGSKTVIVPLDTQEAVEEESEGEPIEEDPDAEEKAKYLQQEIERFKAAREKADREAAEAAAERKRLAEEAEKARAEQEAKDDEWEI